MANDDKIDAIGGIGSKSTQDMEKLGGANAQPPAAPKPPELPQQQTNPMENIKDKINISDEAKSLQ